MIFKNNDALYFQATNQFPLCKIKIEDIKYVEVSIDCMKIYFYKSQCQQHIFQNLQQLKQKDPTIILYSQQKPAMFQLAQFVQQQMQYNQNQRQEKTVEDSYKNLEDFQVQVQHNKDLFKNSQKIKDVTRVLKTQFKYLSPEYKQKYSDIIEENYFYDQKTQQFQNYGEITQFVNKYCIQPKTYFQVYQKCCEFRNQALTFKDFDQIIGGSKCRIGEISNVKYIFRADSQLMQQIEKLCQNAKFNGITCQQLQSQLRISKNQCLLSLQILIQQETILYADFEITTKYYHNYILNK